MNSTRAERIPSRQVLTELPARVVVFLRTIGANPGVRAVLRKGGYTIDDDREGWRLLHEACALRPDAPDPPEEGAARAAMAEIERWVARNFSRLVAAVERLHPDETRLFAGIDGAGSPGESVVVLAKLLERVGEMEPDGAAAAVVETLAQRGLTASERARLAAVVLAAQSVPPVDRDGMPHETREAELVALYRWYTDWATTARAMIGRNDYLVALGLAGRNKRERAGGARTGEGQMRLAPCLPQQPP
jgi:hypothetical protein